jgi:hypothetical protein
MINLNHLKHSAKLAVLAAALFAGYTTMASAHSLTACGADVAEFCGPDLACRESGFQQCLYHAHPGSDLPRPPDPESFSGTPKRELNHSLGLKLQP